MTESTPTLIGRYAIYDRIASGGMASVHIGALLGEAGFSRTVAVKRLHPQFAQSPEFAAMFLDEARICGRIHHPNVVPTLDVIAQEGELFLVMEYVEGESLFELLQASRAKAEKPPISVVATVVSGMLHGLHAAHEAKSDTGTPLGIVHRDVSPQNVLVGTDGVARVLDFGVAKALGRLHTTREGTVKGKYAYMSPEQILGKPLSPSADVFAAAVVVWEALTTERLFHAENEARRMHMILHEPIRSPRELTPEISPELDAIVMRGLERDTGNRYASALAMAEALEAAVPLAAPRLVGAWVRSLSAERLADRAAQVAGIQSSSHSAPPAAERHRASDGPHALARIASRAPAVVEPPAATVSSVLPTMAHASPKRRGVRAISVSAILLVGGGLAVLVARPQPGNKREIEAKATATASAIAASPPQIPSVTIAPKDPVLAAVPAIAAPPASPSPAQGHAGPARKAARASTPDCNPPTWTDQEGHVHLQHGCQ